MLENLFTTIIEISIASSFAIAILLLVTPFIKKVFAAKWRYIIWLVLAVRLIVPFNLNLPSPPVNLTAPTDVVLFGQPTAAPNANQPAQVMEPQIQAQILPEQSHVYSLLEILFCIWLLGVAVFILRLFAVYLSFSKKMKRQSEPITNEKIISSFDRLCLELHINKKPRIWLCKNSCSPMMYGFIEPVLFLPDGEYGDYDLEVILRHELIHYKRRDLWYKLILLLANAVHWFNPLVYLMVKSAQADIEFSCDDKVTKNSDMDFRKRYSQAILNSMNRERYQNVILSTQFKGGKKVMKNRFANILDTSKKRKGIMALFTVTVLILIGGLLVACHGLDMVPIETSGEVYENTETGIGIVFPQEYAGKYTIFQYDVGMYSVFHNATFELFKEKDPDSYRGVLFSIEKWSIAAEEDIAYMNEAAIPLFQTDEFAYFLRQPTPMDCYEDEMENPATKEYIALYADDMINKIAESAYPLVEMEIEDSSQSEPQQGILYVNERLAFSVEFPADWEGLFEIAENYVECNERGGAGITVYQKASRDIDSDSGAIFYIARWIGTWTDEEPPIYAGGSTVVLQSGKYTYILRTPSDVQHIEDDEEIDSEYKIMYEQLDIIKANIRSVDNYYAHYAGDPAEKEFLDSAEGMQLRESAYGAAKAMLQADASELSKYLINPDEASRLLRNTTDVYDDLTWLCFKFTLDSIISADEIRPSYEYALAGEDSFTYISMTFKKISGEWKVSSIGLEK